MLINEIFLSVQGECLTLGAPTAFIRFAGCPLRCSFCDTPYAQDHSDCTEMSPSAVMDRLGGFEFTPGYFCLTGGEPLVQLQHELDSLIRLIVDRFHPRKILIETSGARSIDWLLDHRLRSAISLVVDYKLPSSGATRAMRLENYHRLSPDDVLKFVCKDATDAEASLEILQLLSKVHASRPVVYYHAAGGKAAEWLASFVLERLVTWSRRFDIRLGVQLQKLIWGDERGH